jgi:branched-chain amino acid transport system substrate-binding protein
VNQLSRNVGAPRPGPVRVVVVVAAVIALSACSGSGATNQPAGSAAGSAAAATTIRIGFSAPLSGDQAYYGQSLLDGVTYAAKTFKFSGALQGATVALVSLDDTADPAQGVTVAKTLIADKVDGVLANFNSGVTMATMPVYNAARMPQVTASSNPAITTRGFDTIAELWNDNFQGKIMADFLKTNLKLGSVSVFDDSQSFGQGVAKVFAADAQKNGITVLDSVSLNPQSPDFRGSISAVLAKNPAAIYFGGVTTTGGLLCNQLRSAGFTGPFLGPDGIYDPKVLQGCGTNAGQIYVSFSAPPVNATPELVAYDKDYQQVMGKAQGPYSPAGTILMDFMLNAMNNAGTTEHEAVIKAMHSVKLDSILGTFAIDATGGGTSPTMYIYKADNGQFTYVTSSATMASPAP